MKLLCDIKSFLLFSLTFADSALINLEVDHLSQRRDIEGKMLCGGGILIDYCVGGGILIDCCRGGGISIDCCVDGGVPIHSCVGAGISID